MRKLFGPGVDHALTTIEVEREKVRNGGQSELMDILISRNWQDMLGPFKQDPGVLHRPPSAKHD
jgi:hypothetical protein